MAISISDESDPCRDETGQPAKKQPPPRVATLVPIINRTTEIKAHMDELGLDADEPQKRDVGVSQPPPPASFALEYRKSRYGEYAFIRCQVCSMPTRGGGSRVYCRLDSLVCVSAGSPHLGDWLDELRMAKIQNLPFEEAP